MELHISRMPSPFGQLMLVTDNQEQIHALDFPDRQTRLHRLLRERYGTYELIERPTPPAIADAFARYFAGGLTALDTLVTSTDGSELQRRVWKSLREIPAGQTTSYGAMARALGFEDPRAAIDVGAAIGSNPVNIVVPCHRVIGKNGDLKGYAGGLHRKRWLLEHEGVLAKPNDLFPATENLEEEGR
jgi:methylated-DNA-[protein]-cysteine S-methyltransferase